MTALKSLRWPKALPARAVAIALLCGLSACAWMHDDVKQADTIRPEQVRLAGDIHLGRDGWPDAHWWQRYADPQLDLLIKRALESAPDMRVARSRVEQAQSQVALVEAAARAQVSALGTVDREHLSANGFLGPFATGAHGPWYTSSLVGAVGNYDLDLWGRQRDLIRASIGIRNAQAAEAAEVEIEIAADVAHAYFAMQTDMRKLDLLQQARRIQATTVAAHDARAARGLESRTPGANAQAMLSEMDEQIAQIQTAVREEREILRALIGAGADDLPRIDAKPLPSGEGELPGELSFQLLARRPDLQAQRWTIEASLDQVEAAKAAFYPDFDIKAFFGFNSVTTSMLFHRVSQQINLIPGLTLPIFDGGRLDANLRTTRHASNTAIEQYNEAVVNAVRDVATAGNQLQGLNRQFELQSTKLELTEVAANDAAARFRQGLLPHSTASEADLPVLAQQAELAGVQGQQLDAQIALIKALGGGYDAAGDTTGRTRAASRQ